MGDLAANHTETAVGAFTAAPASPLLNAKATHFVKHGRPDWTYFQRARDR